MPSALLNRALMEMHEFTKNENRMGPMTDMGKHKDDFLDEMGNPLPANAAHFRCTGIREVSYENMWMLPFATLLMLLVPWGWYLRMEYHRQSHNVALRNRAYAILFVCWLLNLMFLVLENDVNHSTGPTPFSSKFFFGFFAGLGPVFVFFRDRTHRDWETRPTGLCRTILFAQGLFWDYAVMALCSAGVYMMVLWSAIACHDVEFELGHYIPFLGWMAYAGILLFFAGKRKHWWSFYLSEGALWICWGFVFNIYFLPSSGGGLLFSYLHGGYVSPNWGPDQQHIFQAFMYQFVGLLAIAFATLKYKSGFHIFVLGYSMNTMLGLHPQYCVLGADLHVLVGHMFLFVGVLRMLDRIFEASLVMVILAGGFAAASECSVTFGDYMFEEVSFILLVAMFWGGWWIYVALIFRSHWMTTVNDEENERKTTVTYAEFTEDVESVPFHEKE